MKLYLVPTPLGNLGDISRRHAETLGSASPFNVITEAELAAHGVNVVIYANQLTRAAFPAMQSVAEDLLRHHRALEVDARLMPFKKIITLIDA